MCPSSPFGIDGKMWDVIVFIPDHCLSIFFSTLLIVYFRASDGTYNTDRNIVITVADVNDNSPVFDPASYTKSLWDGEATGKYSLHSIFRTLIQSTLVISK